MRLAPHRRIIILQGIIPAVRTIGDGLGANDNALFLTSPGVKTITRETDFSPKRARPESGSSPPYVKGGDDQRG